MPSIFSLGGFCHKVPVTLHVEALYLPEELVQWPGSASWKIGWCSADLAPSYTEGLKDCALS